MRKAQPAGDLNRVATLFRSESEPVRTAAIHAAGTWKVAAARAEIDNWLMHKEAPPATRSAAIEAVAAYGDAPARELLRTLAAAEATPLADRLSALGALASLDVNAAARGTVDLLTAAPAGLDPAAAVSAIASRKEGPAALAKALAGKKLAPDVAKLVLRTVRAAPQPSDELIAAVQAAGGLGEAAWKLTPELVAELTAEVQTKGDPARGEAIYRTAANQCLKCHAIGGAGGLVGPDMVSLGATAQIDYLLESLIAPAAKVKENFHSKVVLDGDGQVTSGIPVRETEQEIVLRDAEDKLVTIAKSNIENIKDGRSLMPDGLVDSLTRQELVDLTAFLAQLGKVGGSYTVGPEKSSAAGRCSLFERSQPQAQPDELRHGGERRSRLCLDERLQPGGGGPAAWTACRRISRTRTWSRRHSSGSTSM
jgi:putative heme-binding domain-containing protein